MDLSLPLNIYLIIFEDIDYNKKYYQRVLNLLGCKNTLNNDVNATCWTIQLTTDQDQMMLFTFSTILKDSSIYVLLYVCMQNVLIQYIIIL